MATTVGAAVLSDELVVAQSDKIALGTEVQTLVIEFDQSKYEKFFSFGVSRPVSMCKCRRVSYETPAPAAFAEFSRANLENQSLSPKLAAPRVSQVLASGEPRSACIRAGSSNDPPSRRVKQRQRQNQARRRVRALVSLNGFRYCPKVVKQAEGHNDEKHNEPRCRTPNFEPRRQQGVHSKEDEPRRRGEPRHQQGIHSKENEPRLRGEPRQQYEVPSKVDEPRPSGEPCHEVPLKEVGSCSRGEPRHQYEPRRQSRIRRQLRQVRQSLLREPPLYEAQFSASTEDSPTFDLRDYLTCKRSVNQTHSHCCCEKLVSAVFAQCLSTRQPSVFERLSDPSVRRRRFRHKRLTARSDHSLGVTINMIGRSRSKTPMGTPESSDAEYSPGLCSALVGDQGVYRRTRVRTRVAIPLDHQQLTGGTHEEFENSGMATSQPSNAYLSDQASVLMADKEEEMAKKIEEQQALILAQQESIRRLEAMMEKLVGKKKLDENGSKSKHERYEEDRDVHSVSSEAESNQRTKERDHKLYDFQKQLDALKLQRRFKELGIVRPYPPEWDDVPYPPKFKSLDLVQFDGKSSPSQHIYYFQARTGYITGNDPIMTRLFISTLKGVAFEWFRRLEPGSINSWRDLERLFMARFFDDDTEVSLATLLAKKQNKTESVSSFVKRFRNRSLHASDQVSETTLMEMCRNNLSINILSNMGAVRTRSWKDLIRQGEQVENMLKRINAEEPCEFRGEDDQADFTSHTHAKGKDTLGIATTPSSKSFDS